VRTLFAKNKVRFARAEQLCCEAVITRWDRTRRSLNDTSLQSSGVNSLSQARVRSSLLYLLSHVAKLNAMIWQN